MILQPKPIPSQGLTTLSEPNKLSVPFRFRAATMRKWRALAIRIVWLAIICDAHRTACYPQASSPPIAERQPSLGVYIPPNEQHPALALPIYRKSNHGVYVSVGTERSFIGAALTEAEALIVIDYDPEAIRFANINRALLAASTDRADYVNLRLRASEEVWRQRSLKLTGEDKETLASPASWMFWDQKVRKNTWAWNSAFQHFNTEPKNPGEPFYASDYLFDGFLYNHLSRLAKSSRIWSRVVDLRRDDEVRAFCDDLKSKHLRLGVIDTSDVPSPSEAGTSVAAQYVMLFSEYAQDDTLFLNTAPARAKGVVWSYFAFTNRTLRGLDQTTLKRWYEIEIKKIADSAEASALLDDPEVSTH
jgi:hypothetical protein